MKKVLLLMVLVLPFVFQSCSKDEDDAALSGTEWVCKMSIDDLSIETHLKFLDGTRFQITYVGDDNMTSGTYAVSGSTITLTDSEGTVLNGTISGNKMTFSDPESPFQYVFTKL
jgi:hypothetical protein